MAKSLQDYIDEKERKQTASSSSSEEKNQGGFWGGAEYLGTRLVDGLVSNVEGIVDFTVGGLADLFGADKFAERQFANDWYNYNRADEKYNPGKGMSVAGDIVGVVGGALPDIGIGLLTGGAGLGAKIIGKGISLGTSFASSAGRGVSEAVGKTGKLGGKEWAGGLGSGGLAAGIEAASGGLGDLFGGVFGKTGVEMGSELAESFGKKASTETVGNIFGKIAGKEAAGEVGEGAGKKLISKLWNSKFGKELLGEMASEGIEEGLEAWIEPEIIQGTYDPKRPNATIGDIAYSAMLGGLGGGLISGGLGGISGAVNKTRLTTRGGTISNDSTKLNNLMHNAEVIANYENNKHTGSQIFSQVESLYNDVKASLEKNGGKVTLATMENIGRLDALVAASTVQPSIVNAAKGIANNAESMAAALNNFYSRNGQSSNITAEQLTAGLKLNGTSQEFVASVTKALNTNPIFRQVVMNNMLGNMDFDAQSYARSIYGDMDIRNIATQQNLNRFLSTADAATLSKAGEALGITDWSRVTPEELAQRIYDYRDSGRAELTREGISAVREAKGAKGYTNGMPTSPSALTEGATRFQSPGADFAIVRHGNSYRLYDYETGKITNAMSEGDMAALVQRIKDRQAEIGRQSEMQALERELDKFANENVPEYKKLSEGEKEAVRATLRYARANGISLKDQILFARIAAKSGMNIITTTELEDGKPAWFDGYNTIYIDASKPRTRTFKGLLGHEMFHKLFQDKKAKKLFRNAYNAVPDARRAEIEQLYTEKYTKLNKFSEREIQDIGDEEVAAAYAEEIFNTPDVWSYILDGEPSLKDKVLSFFKGAPKHYDFAAEMDPAAREWLKEYKKLFDKVAEYNAGGTVAADVGTTLRTERVIQRVGKVVDDNTSENANKKSASGTKAQDSGERFAFMGVAEDGRIKKDFNSGERSALADGKKATTSDVAAAKRAISESGIDPAGIIAVADKYFDRCGGELTRTGVRYEFLGAAETMLEDDAGAMERAYAKIEALADELTYNEKNANSLREDLDQIKRHVREITFEIRDKDKGEFDSLGGYNEFRKKHFGKLKIGKEGASIDSTYGELQNQYGTSFFPEVNTVAEMLIRIGDVVDMDPNFETESDIDLEAARNDMAVAITRELRSAFDKKLAAKAEKLSKSDAEAYKARITARAETKAAKEIARAKKRLEKIEAKLRAQAEKQIADAGKKLNETLETERTKLRAQAEKQIADAGKKLNETLETERTKLTAEYETDKVFSQGSVKNNLGTVDSFKTLPAAERSEISRRVWKDFNESNGYDSREWLVIKHSAELVDAICKAKPDGVSKYERDAIADQVNAALKKIAAGGKTSVRGRMEGELREEIKAQESVKRELLSDIYQELKKIDDVKTARFVAASDYKGADFKGSINSLTKMDWRGRLNDSIVRSEMKNLLAWYHPDNPMLKGFESGDFKVTNYDQGIKERLDVLANGWGKLTNSELGMLADTLRYFTKLVGEYDSVYVEGKWQSGEKLVYQMRDNIEKQNKMKVPMAVRALRNRVLSGDLRAFADPLSVMKLADMYEDGIFTKVYKDWMQGEINADAEALNIKSEYDAFMKANRKYLARAEKDTVTLHGVEINRLQLVSYVMTLKRKGSWLGVASEGVVFRDKNGRDVAMRPVVPIENGPGFNKKLEAAIKAEQGIAERLLTDKDKEYMQILERGFEKAKVTKAAGDMQRLGFVNVVDGYYYPIRRAYTEHISEFEAELLATDRYANASFNKKTIERAKSALLISSADSVFNSHINGVTGYMYLSPVMDSFNKLYKLKALKTKPGDGADIGALYALPGSTFSLQSLIGQSPSTWRQDGKVVGFDYLQNLMLDTMGGRTRLVGDDWAGKLRAGYVGFALGGNIKTMATQLSSMFASTSVLQPFNHFKSVVSWRGGMDNYSTVAKLRDSDYTILKSTAVTDQVNRFAAWFTKGMSLMDRLVVYRAWNAAQMQVAQKGGPKLGTEENLIAAGKLLDKVILETQQNAFTSRKTEAARRGNSIVKAMIMFKSDAITTQGRIIDAWGELQYLTATKKGVEGESKAEAKKQIKTAKKQLSKAVGAVVASSAYMVAIAELFRAFYGKLDKDEEDEEKATRLRGEFILNALGGIPVISAIAEAFSSSYDFESMEFSAINDIFDTAKQCRDYFDDVFAGKATERDGLKMIERTLYGAGQLFGIPFRNLKNLSYGITRLISPEAAYKWDSALYSQTYGKDLADALEKEDYQMAEVILETAFGEKMGSGLSDDAIKVLSRLAKNGENVIPSAVSDKITIDGEERELTGEELKAVREKYGEAVEQINKIIQTDVFRDFDDEMKADAVRKIYDLYKNLAYDGAVGSKKDEEAYLLSKVVDADVLCLNEILSIYTADVDENGKTVSGSKRGKVIAAIADMDISDEEKLLLIATQGYALKDDDIYGMSKEKADELLFDYIASLDLSDEERLALYKYAGYDVKDGEVSGSAASGSSGSAASGSSGSSKKSFSGSLANPSGILYKATKNRARRIGKIV